MMAFSKTRVVLVVLGICSAMRLQVAALDCSRVRCSSAYAPVCAPNGNSYVNECVASCADVANTNGPFKKGLCPPKTDCICTLIYAPVCDASGKTQPSSCTAGCNKAPLPWSQGECPPKCGSCPPTYSPVCAPDGLSYGNECKARCASSINVNGSFASGLCPPDPACICLAEWTPVCDAAGKTWTNACNANCMRAPLPYKQGACWSCKACPKAYEPTCAPDGFSYGNTCHAFCAAKASEKKGPFLGGLCPPPGMCPCPAIFAPVCDFSGKTWPNACSADCSRAPRPFAPGACDPCGKVPPTFAPVCGTDKKTFHNKQAATCQKVKVAYTGSCHLCPAVPECSKAPKGLACGKNGRTYCSPCAAKYKGGGLAAHGACKAKCLPQGSVCLLAKSKCCGGLSCNGGPVLRLGQVLGTCISGPGPKG